jgi:serine protease Do
VIDGSPAANAGIQAGDVIISFNGDPVTSSRKLTRLLSEVSPDQTAKIVVVRGGSEREMNVTVGKRPMPKFEEGSFYFEFPKDFPNVQIPRMPPMGEIPRGQVTPQMPNFPNENFVWHFGPSRQIGIGVMPLSRQLAEHFGVEGGALINDVRPDSRAAKAGLRAGDIIVEAEGRAVKGDGDIVRAISEKKEGDVMLTIVSNGSRQTVKVTPEEFKGGFNFEGPMPPRAPGRVTASPTTPGAMPVPFPADVPIFRGRII